MNGKQFLDLLVGTSSSQGLTDKNPSDANYRAFMLECLNLVAKDIQNRQQTWHWRWLEKTATAPTVADQIDYDLPTDIDTNKIIAVFDRTDDVAYKFIPHDLFVKLIPDPSNDSGGSRFYTFWANVIKLWPIPDSVWTFYLRYIQEITAWADSTADNEIPQKYDPVIIDGALAYAYKLDPDLGNETRQIQLYEAGVNRMIRDNSVMPNHLPRARSHRNRGRSPLMFPTNEGFV